MRRLAVPLVGAFASGMTPGLVAAALAFMHVGETAKSLFVSSAMCGMIVASLIGGFMADRFGRVGAMRLAGWIAFLSVPSICVSDALFAVSVAGRFAQGFGLGLFSVLLPLYIAETQPDDRRGRATAFYQFSNSLGGIVGAFFGLAIAAWGQHSFSWGDTPIWVLDISSIVPFLLIYFVGSYFLKPVVASRHGVVDALGTGTIKGAGKSFAFAVVVLALTSATGIGAVMHYSVMMMSEAGLAGTYSNSADAAMRIAGLLASLISAAFIDRKGQRFVLRIGTAGATCALFALSGIFLALKMGCLPISAASGVAVAVLLCVFVAFFSFGPGVCVWVVAAEVLPASVRARGMSFALLGNQAVTAAISSVFLPVATHFGYAPLFFAFALAAAAYFAIASRCLPYCLQNAG